MIINYIGLDGNIKTTEDVLDVPANLEKIGETFFEKKVSEAKKSKKEVVAEEIPAEEVNDSEDVQDENTTDEVAEKALAFLKEKKIRGCHLLKGAKLMEKAIAEGFTL